MFPSATELASGKTRLASLGMPRPRASAIVELARAVRDGRVVLDPHADALATMEALRRLPGIGDWTAQYVAMRALRWPDAFPAGDVALHKALGVQQARQPAREAEAASQAWKPWRSYAVVRAWSAGQLPPEAPAAPPPRGGATSGPAKPVPRWPAKEATSPGDPI
jgi:AraC family transcriptional regulator of adaptative response / DNA-3-methyladenine glycosylase II